MNAPTKKRVSRGLTKRFFYSVVATFALVVHAWGEDLPVFSYPDSETAQHDWKPTYGNSKAVRVEKLEDGTTCLALDAEFSKARDRANWDWTSPLDLSQVGSVAFDVVTDHSDLIAFAYVFFGSGTTGNDWYPKIWGAGLSETWRAQNFHLTSFAMNGKPDWSRITKFRFSVWSSKAGKVTLRLRNFRTRPKDPMENILKNGSFEIASAGLPYGWGNAQWGIAEAAWVTNMDSWRKHWHLDSTVAKDGKNSLCIENDGSLPRLVARSVWIVPALQEQVQRYTLSAWLKSDQDKMSVAIGPDASMVEVGREWTQVQAEIGWHKDAGVSALIKPISSGKLWMDAVQIRECKDAPSEFRPCFDDGNIAETEKLVDWSPPKRVDQISSGREVSWPVQTTKVEIDPNGRILLNGEPYLNHAIGWQRIPDPEVLDFIAKSGFRSICVTISKLDTPEKVKAMFDRCAKVGLRIIPWFAANVPRESLARYIKELKDHPALLVWYVFDEPANAEMISEAEARLKLARELDPLHPAYVNYLVNDLDKQAGDIYSSDVYPVPRRPLMDSISLSVRMKAAAEKENKPVWIWIQTSGFDYMAEREPTPRELSCMVYGSLIAGARGINYWAHIPRTKPCFDEMRALCVEVDALAPALFSPDKAPEIQCDKPQILCKAFACRGEKWVIAVNARSSKCQPRLMLAGAAGDAEVVFEGRKIKVQNSAWQDDFGPYERHVYRLPPP